MSNEKSSKYLDSFFKGVKEYMLSAPVRGGRPLSAEEIENMSPEERDAYIKKIYGED